MTINKSQQNYIALRLTTHMFLLIVTDRLVDNSQQTYIALRLTKHVSNYCYV